MTREEAEKELIAMLQEAEGGPSYSMGEVDAYMRELLHPKNQIYLTGDTHGRFERIISFCERQQVQPESTFITEQWLDTIESRLHYERWYCGHYHTDKEIDKIRFMFQDYTMLPHQISLSAEKEMIRRMQRQAEIVEALGLMDEAQEEK